MLTQPSRPWTFCSMSADCLALLKIALIFFVSTTVIWWRPQRTNDVCLNACAWVCGVLREYIVHKEVVIWNLQRNGTYVRQYLTPKKTPHSPTDCTCVLGAIFAKNSGHLPKDNSNRYPLQRCTDAEFFGAIQSEPSEAQFLYYVHTLGYVQQRLVWTAVCIHS